MLLGLHTYSFYLHGIGQAWADFKLPWPRQMSTFELFDEAVRLGLDGLHIETEMEIPMDDMQQALRMENETIERSIRYCRDVLGIKKEDPD
jgi:hypothetical protein